MKENKSNEKLFELLSSKNFKLLTSDEKKLVLSEMESDEYNQLHELQNNLHSTTKENNLSPSAMVKQNLLAAFDNHHFEKQKPKGVLRFLYLKVPMYQSIAAAFVSCVFLTALYFLNDFNSTIAEHIVYKFKTDTVYVQSNPVTKIDTIKKQESVIPEIKPVTVKESRSQDPEFDKALLCRSIKSDSDLKQFMVSL